MIFLIRWKYLQKKMNINYKVLKMLYNKFKTQILCNLILKTIITFSRNNNNPNNPNNPYNPNNPSNPFNFPFFLF